MTKTDECGEAPARDRDKDEEPSYECVEVARSGGAHPVAVSIRPRPATRPVRLQADPKEPRVGDRLGPYYLLERIGEGGMARVFRAVHEKLQRTVAVKVLRRSAADADGLGRFLREARAVNRARHPNLIEIFDIVEGPVGGVSYLVMEWLEGKTLLDRRRECGGRIPIKELLLIIHDVAMGLHSAHEVGLVHCDLKPANIFLIASDDGGRARAKVIDFGAVLDHLEQKGTEEQYVVGTLSYLAPEQMLALGGDRRIDVYALGICLFELSVGKRPFLASTMKGLLQQRLLQAPSARRAAGSGVSIPAELDHLIGRCLAPHPDQRYPDMLALAADLEALSRRLERPALRRATPFALMAAAPLALVGVAAAALLLDRLPIFARLRSQRSTVEEAAPRLPVEVQSMPPGAKVLFHGQVLGTTPCTVRLPPGRQEVELRWSERQHSRQVIEVRAAPMGPHAPGASR